MTRAFAEVRRILAERARTRRNPFAHTEPETAVAILERLSSTEHAPWVAAFMAEAEACAARRDWRGAYGYSRVARYPSLTSEEKRAAYVRSRDWYLRSVAERDPATLRIEIPFAARAGEGLCVPAYLRVPRASAPRPVVVTWGGIDAFKEERRTDAFVAEGWATLAIDMPGTGEAPISGAGDAERMWDAV
ncbi:MAG TPA: alpha/beta hydrolase, partial [Candidatus Limnocylindria bacterium]|nr:alpha/beta hydrolase [Candidatus Limnocylindria bacterium]